MKHFLENRNISKKNPNTLVILFQCNSAYSPYCDGRTWRIRDGGTCRCEIIMTCAANGARSALTIESCENASTSLLFFRSLFRTFDGKTEGKLFAGKNYLSSDCNSLY